MDALTLIPPTAGKVGRTGVDPLADVEARAWILTFRKPETVAFNPKPETRNPKPETRNSITYQQPTAVEDSTRYQLLRILEDSPDISQRELARRLGLSLGKTNYCLRAITEKGWVKARNFRNSGNKAAYMYVLTPKGITAKARITRQFLNRKVEEYEQLRLEIEELRAQVERA